MHYHDKSQGKLQPDWLTIVREKVKKSEKTMNYAKLMPNYALNRHHLHWLGAHHLTKAACEISVRSLTDFLKKGGKSAKTQIMPNYAN